MTFWGRYKKEQSFIAHPATQHDVYKSRMADRYAEQNSRPDRKIMILEEEDEAKAEQAMEKSKGGFWQAIAGIFTGSKEQAPVQKAKWPATANKNKNQ